MKRLFLVSVLFFISLVFLVILPDLTNTAFASENILFEDDFNDGDSVGWDFTGLSGWLVNNTGEYGITLGSGVSNTFPDANVWNNTWRSIRYSVELRGVSGVDKNILVKYKSPTDFIEMHRNNGGIGLAKLFNGSFTLLDRIDFNGDSTLENGVPYKIDVEIIDDVQINVYIDGVLKLSAEDPLPRFDNWTVGLRSGVGQVWFDNVKVVDLSDNTVGPFELPFNYEGRGEGDESLFKNAFWERLNASFDHKFAVGEHVPFTGVSYKHDDCPKGSVGVECYDSHNGTDFSTKAGTSTDVFSVASGDVVYRSDISGPEPDCVDDGGFGCVVIAKYNTDDYGDLYGLFAHLEEIDVATGSAVADSTVLGSMGNTGCSKFNCGEHLHFGVMRSLDIVPSLQRQMTDSDWRGLLQKIKPLAEFGGTNSYRPFCRYIAPNGARFAFIDPSGWALEATDPWELPEEKNNKGGCAISSPYLWKYELLTE